MINGIMDTQIQDIGKISASVFVLFRTRISSIYKLTVMISKAMIHNMVVAFSNLVC